MDFDTIVRGGESALEEMIRIQQQEGLSLDFKSLGEDGQAPLAKDGKLNREGRKMLSKLLSAFSNSAGGVIVMGVDCRNREGLDCAEKLEPVRNWRQLQSYVGSQVGDLLQPKNEHIRVEGFPSLANTESGYLIVDVPRSERRPHMCAMTNCYYKRSGSDTYTMEHYDVEDAFRRASTAELELELQLRNHGSGGRTDGSRDHWLLVTLLAKNVGLGSAKHICVKVKATVPVSFGSRSMPSINKVSHIDGTHYAYLAGDDVILPGEKRALETFPITAVISRERAVEVPNAKDRSYIDLFVEVLAENTPAVRREMRISASDILSSI